MNRLEKRALSTLTSLYALRMLGLFMVLPILSLHIDDIRGATAALMGLALGIYGATQAIFQIPLGMLSDRIGRKPVIILGLLLFTAGSLLAGFADNITLLILGRALQGAGAIAASVMALLTDLTREQYRTKALAVVGMVIGLSFSVAVVIGPLISAWLGLSGVFFVTAILAVLGIALVIFAVPTPQQQHAHADHRWVDGGLRQVLNNKQIWLMSLSVFILHLSLMAIFFVVPLGLQTIGIAVQWHWLVYVVVVLLGFILMIPLMISSEKYQKGSMVFQLSVLAMLVASGLWYWLPMHSLVWILPFTLFFIAFSFIEATLPSWISRIAPAGAKGAAMGVFSSSQFLGAAVGGWLSGYLYQFLGVESLFILLIGVQLIWLVASRSLKQPAMTENISVQLQSHQVGQFVQLRDQLLQIDGITQVQLLAEEKLLYIKANKQANTRDVIESVLLDH